MVHNESPSLCLYLYLTLFISLSPILRYLFFMEPTIFHPSHDLNIHLPDYSSSAVASSAAELDIKVNGKDVRTNSSCRNMDALRKIVKGPNPTPLVITFNVEDITKDARNKNTYSHKLSGRLVVGYLPAVGSCEQHAQNDAQVDIFWCARHMTDMAIGKYESRPGKFVSGMKLFQKLYNLDSTTDGGDKLKRVGRIKVFCFIDRCEVDTFKQKSMGPT